MPSSTLPPCKMPLAIRTGEINGTAETRFNPILGGITPVEQRVWCGNLYCSQSANAQLVVHSWLQSINFVTAFLFGWRTYGHLSVLDLGGRAFRNDRLVGLHELFALVSICLNFKIFCSGSAGDAEQRRAIMVFFISNPRVRLSSECESDPTLSIPGRHRDSTWGAKNRCLNPSSIGPGTTPLAAEKLQKAGRGRRHRDKALSYVRRERFPPSVPAAIAARRDHYRKNLPSAQQRVSWAE